MQSIALKNEAAKDVRLYPPIVDIFKKKYLDLRKRWDGYVSGKQYRLFAADASFWLLSIARDVIVFIVLFDVFRRACLSPTLCSIWALSWA